MTNGKKKVKQGEETKEVDDLHEATLFFPLPDGQARKYKLIGKANAPEAQGLISVNVEAKKQKYISIKVDNWLKTAQRFKVSWEIEGALDKTTFIRAANTFDLAGSSSKDFKLNFLTYKAGETKFKVMFLNETSGEFLFFNVKVVASEPGIL